MNKKEFDIKKIIKTAIENADHPFCNEEDFRIAVVEQIKKRYKNDSLLIIPEYAYKENGKDTENIDIYVFDENSEYAIELKYRPANKTGNYELSKNDKKIKIDKEIAEPLNEIEGIYTDSSSKGIVITWQNKKAEYKYYYYEQSDAKDCVDDINKMLNFVGNINDKCVAYTVVLSDRDWKDNTGEINLVDSQRNRKDNKSKINNNENATYNPLDIVDISKGPHKDFWLKIHEIKKK